MRWCFFIWLCALLPTQILQGDTIRKDYCIMNGEARRGAEKEIYEKFGLRVVGAGGGAITVVRGVTMDVETDSPISLAEGRRLLIACSDILLKHLNAYRPLRPFLFEYPFPIERISFAIFISPEGKMKIPKDAPTIFSLCEGNIRYSRPPDNFDKPAPPGEIHIESHQEALQILASEDKSLHLSKSPANQNEPSSSSKQAQDEDKAISPVSKFIQKGETASTTPRYVGPQEEREMSWHLDDYANTIAKKYDMQFHRVGSFSDENDDIYSLMFISFHQMTLEQGKKLATTLIKDFLCELKTSPVVKKYNEHRNNFYKKWRFPPLLSEEPIPEQMGLKISFWDKNFDRPKKTHLAEIVFLHGDFYYYEADPETQALKLVLKVSYEDAIGKQDQSIK